MASHPHACVFPTYAVGGRKAKPKVRSTNQQTQKTTSCHPPSTSRHAEITQKNGAVVGARILVLPLGGNTKQRSSAPIFVGTFQPCFPAMQPLGVLVSRRRTTLFCGVGAKPTVGGRPITRLVGERRRRPKSVSAIGAGANSTTRNDNCLVCVLVVGVCTGRQQHRGRS